MTPKNATYDENETLYVNLIVGNQRKARLHFCQNNPEILKDEKVETGFTRNTIEFNNLLKLIFTYYFYIHLSFYLFPKHPKLAYPVQQQLGY